VVEPWVLLTPVTDILEGLSRGENFVGDLVEMFIGDLVEVVLKDVVGGSEA
jgi:hypothetical protein